MFYIGCRNVCLILCIIFWLSAIASAGFFDKNPHLKRKSIMTTALISHLTEGHEKDSRPLNNGLFRTKNDEIKAQSENSHTLKKKKGGAKGMQAALNHGDRNILITKFKYESCDGRSLSRNPAWLRDADVMTTAYGDLDVLGTLVTAVNLTGPVKASVKLRRKVLGLYVPLPCIKEFGSCNYPDLCIYGYSQNEECPPIFDEHDVPCRCPIKPGVYTFPGGQFPLPKTRWAGLLAGQYKGLVKFYDQNRFVACYKFYFTLE